MSRELVIHHRQLTLNQLAPVPILQICFRGLKTATAANIKQLPVSVKMVRLQLLVIENTT